MAAPWMRDYPKDESRAYLNRELSWLEFNQRVLDEVLDPNTPLLERVKFFAITSSNLDEFFEVRVAGIKQQIESGSRERTPDGLTPAENLRVITLRVRLMLEQQYRCWREDLLPALARHGIRLLKVRELGKTDFAWLDRFTGRRCIRSSRPWPLTRRIPSPICTTGH